MNRNLPSPPNNIHEIAHNRIIQLEALLISTICSNEIATVTCKISLEKLDL